MMLTNQWRMPLMFLISGLAVSFVWGKYKAGRFLARRSWRLLLDGPGKFIRQRFQGLRGTWLVLVPDRTQRRLLVRGIAHSQTDSGEWLPSATEAVYPWYILHQTIVIVIGYNLSQLQLGPVIKPLLVLGGTLGGCFVLHEYVIRRTKLLRPLFGLN